MIPWLKRHKFFVLGTLVALAAVVGAFYSFKAAADSAAADYQAARAKQVSTVRASFDNINAATRKNKPNAKEVIARLGTFKAVLQQQKKTMPAIVDIPLGGALSDSYKQTTPNEAVRRTEALLLSIEALEEYGRLQQYIENVFANPSLTKPIATKASAKACEAAWRQAAKKVASFSMKNKNTQAIIASTENDMIKVADYVGALKQAYAKNNRAELEKGGKKLEKRVQAVRSNGHRLQAIGLELEQDVQTASQRFFAHP